MDFFVLLQKKQLELEDKMDLASYLLKPVQRMGKYALLLKQLLKECPERETEHKALKVWFIYIFNIFVSKFAFENVLFIFTFPSIII